MCVPGHAQRPRSQPVRGGTTTDAAGNNATTSFGPVNIDLTPPLVTITGVSAGVNYPPTPSPVCNTTDALSGVATKATLTITALGGAQTGTFTATCSGATDLAGNLAGSGLGDLYRLDEARLRNHQLQRRLQRKRRPAGRRLGCGLHPASGRKGERDVQIGQGATFNDEGATISGNLQATNAKWISVLGGGTIGGNVQLQGLSGTPASGDNALCATTVNGNVQVQSNGTAAPVDIGNLGACKGLAALKVGGNLQVQGNAAAVTVGGNTVSGNLQVEETPRRSP